ncbi:MAG: hypothetical protein PUA65_08570 [Acidaminococcus fermentans]|nr:hypothetical protein [Acidaminococcus fermentans]
MNNGNGCINSVPVGAAGPAARQITVCPYVMRGAGPALPTVYAVQNQFAKIDFQRLMTADKKVYAARSVQQPPFTFSSYFSNSLCMRNRYNKDKEKNKPNKPGQGRKDDPS